MWKKGGEKENPKEPQALPAALELYGRKLGSWGTAGWVGQKENDPSNAVSLTANAQSAPK